MGASPRLVNNDAPVRRLRRALLAGAALCLVAAGVVLWWREGEAMFSAMTAAAVALCF